jgi:hypothetical protein
MSPLPAATNSQNPFEAAKARLIERISNALIPPKAYSLFPKPDEHETIAEHIREAASLFDEWLAAIGNEFADNAAYDNDTRRFKEAFTDAIDGNATWCLEREAAVMREERAA